MSRISLLAAVLLAAPAATGLEPEAALPGRIVVEAGAPSGEISPLIYGAAVKWVENGNRLLDPASGRLRPELVEKLGPLRIPVWRFPGGILADHYHWRDGVGAPSSRPARPNPMDGSSHANRFGTDEFIELCRALRAEALVTLNFGSGTLDEALAWQRHFLSRGFPVRYWEVGNEIYLAEPRARASIPGNDERIFHRIDEYAREFPRWAAALRGRDPRALVGAVLGTSNTSRENAGWSESLARACPAGMDFVAAHDAFAPLIFTRYDYGDPARRAAAYQAMFAQPLQFADDVRRIRREFQRCRPSVAVAVTEHFPLFGGGAPEQILAVLDQSRTLAAALYTASLFHAFAREGVLMANYNIAVSKWFGALITDGDGGPVLTPTYHVYDLYRNHFGTRMVASRTEGPTFSTAALGSVAARTDVPYLDALATRGADGTFYLAVVNRHPARAVEARLSLGVAVRSVEVVTLGGTDPSAVNGRSLTPTTQGGPADAIRPRRSTWATAGDRRYAFPRSSLTILHWRHP